MPDVSGACLKKIKSNHTEISCSTCHHKYHTECAHLNESDLKYLCENNEKRNCTTCISNIEKTRSASVSSQKNTIPPTEDRY